MHYAEVVKLVDTLDLGSSAARCESSSLSFRTIYTMVGVAQLVEPRIVIPVVVGSSPIVHPSVKSLRYLLVFQRNFLFFLSYFVLFLCLFGLTNARSCMKILRFIIMALLVGRPWSLLPGVI